MRFRCIREEVFFSNLQPRVKVVFSVRNLKEIKGAWFHGEREDIGATDRLPTQTQEPAMQVAGEAKVGIHDLFALQIVSNVADVERPVGIELQIARNTHVVVAYYKGVARGSITGCNKAAFEGYPVA